MEFCLLLKNKREAAELSIKELAQKTNISETTLQKYEDGTSLPTIEGLVKLCHAIGTTPNEMLEDVSFSDQRNNICGTQPPKREAPEASLSKEEKIKYLSSLKKSGVRLYAALVQRKLGVGYYEALELLELVKAKE